MLDHLDPAEPKVTSRLIAELNLTISQSDLVRDIVSKSESVKTIEQSSGPSRRTHLLRRQIADLEDQLKYARKS